MHLRHTKKEQNVEERVEGSLERKQQQRMKETTLHFPDDVYVSQHTSRMERNRTYGAATRTPCGLVESKGNTKSKSNTLDDS